MYAADTGAGGLVPLLTGGYFAPTAPSGTAPPYMTGHVQADGESDSFGGNGSIGYFAFGIYTPKTDSSGNAIGFGTDSEPIIARLMTVFHNQSTTVTFGGLTWNVFFKRSSGIEIPEADFAWHHAETYLVTCFPAS